MAVGMAGAPLLSLAAAAAAAAMRSVGRGARPLATGAPRRGCWRPWGPTDFSTANHGVGGTPTASDTAAVVKAGLSGAGVSGAGASWTALLAAPRLHRALLGVGAGVGRPRRCDRCLARKVPSRRCCSAPLPRPTRRRWSKRWLLPPRPPPPTGQCGRRWW
ncbi:hypothetical protein I4F81_002917 [Pyropia yezoensis]|uniref:Uncharacterized protein n=1 Tax=Pyropia yezoensis TaxID=2788 RepID=A0ACC3BRV9_PYRYE|nr:hypothetical protein I4F81_002917 [Neopyropia yezoensis]